MGPEPTNAEQRDPVQDRLPQAREASTSCLAGSPGPAHPPRAGRRPGDPATGPRPLPQIPLSSPPKPGGPWAEGRTQTSPALRTKSDPRVWPAKSLPTFPISSLPQQPPALTWLCLLLSPELVWALQAFLGALSSSGPPPQCHRALCPSDRALGVTSSRKRPSRQTRRW